MHDADHCEVVQAAGLVLGSTINCAVLALLDTGIAMRGVLVAGGDHVRHVRRR